MIFTLTDRNYNPLDAYETDEYLIGTYIGSILETLEIEVAVNSFNASSWIQGNYIMCTDERGRNYWFTIYDADDSLSSDYKKLSCFSGTIDIVSEEYPPIKATSAQPFTWYFDKIFFDTGIKLGINELEGLSRTLEFEGTNTTNVEMLQYVLNGFDNADARIEVEFDGVKPVNIILNVYRHLGAVDPQELLSSEIDNLEDLERKGSISELATALRPKGEETNEVALTLKGKYYEEKDSDGNILYYSPKDRVEIFSVKGHQNFFVDLPNKATGEFDGYIVRDYDSQAKTQDALWREALIKLKKIDHAVIEYDAKGSITCDIGDNIQITALDMKPPIMISARVTEYKYNDDDSSRNEYKFSNFVDLESNMSELDKHIAEIKKTIDYVVDIITDYAIADDNVIVPDDWIVDIPDTPKGKYTWARTRTFMSKGNVNTAYNINYVATDGEKGDVGDKGDDGKSTYLHQAYSWSSDGTDRFTLDYPNENLVVGSFEKGYLNTANGSEVAATNNIRSGFIEVSIGNYSFGVAGSRNAVNVFYYDENKVFINRVTFSNTRIIDVPNKGFVRLAFGHTETIIEKNQKFEKGSIVTIYTPSPQDDYENAYPKYKGEYTSFDPIASTNPSDYKWAVFRGENGEDVYSVQIISSQGSTFKNGVISTELSAIIFKGSDDVTSLLSASCFSWKRTSLNTASDKIWNDKNAGGRKSVVITRDDVFQKATFSCALDIELAEILLK